MHALRRAAAACAALVIAGCATPGRDVVASGQADLAAAPTCCESLAQAPRQPLPVGKEPAIVIIDKKSPAWNFGGNKAFFVLYELPPFDKPYSLTVSSQATAAIGDLALLIPRVALYGEAFQPLRFFDEKTLRNRGNDLERTIFMNASNAGERYIAIFGSDLSASIERSYQMVTTTPVVAGPVIFNMVSGHDGKSVLRSSPVGQLTIEVHGLAPAR